MDRGIFGGVLIAYLMIASGLAVPLLYSTGTENGPTLSRDGGFSASYDLGSQRSNLMEGFERVTATTAYDPLKGFGLLAPAVEFDVTPRMATDLPSSVLSRSWVYGQYADDLTRDGLRSEDTVSFRADVPNGTYRIIVWIGDLEKGVYSMNISVNDEWVVEEVDAYHNVFRSMYYEFNKVNGDPRSELFLNYGMARPYFLTTTATDGRLVINVTGNDTAYETLLQQELERDPAYSYLSWMSTGTYKYSAGTGPWRYIGGPFTNASVMGIQIYDLPDLPVDGVIGSLSADPDVADPDLLQAITSANDGDLEAAFSSWEDSLGTDLSGREKLARAHIGMILAGALSLDREIDILHDVERDLSDIGGLENDRARKELLWQVQRANTGLRYEFERILYDEVQPKNHFFEANKAFVLLNSIPADSPLYPKMQLWAARCLMNLDPHRWTSASGTARDMMEAIRPLDPDNPYIMMYWDTTREGPPQWESPTPVISTTGTYDNWTLNDYNTGYDDAPEWARTMHEELGWLYDITDWWVDNRQQSNGYLGGGWTDDVEMIGLFGFDALISEGANEKSLEGAGRFVEGMLSSGQVDMEKGYSQAFADVEHTAELTGDSLPMMIAVDFGNPKWIEFSMKTSVLMRDLWMGTNERGWYQFKSNYLSATQVGTGGTAEDSWINFRAVLPALWAWWYSNDPEVEGLLVDWADSWVRAALSTDKGKPYGVIPAGIGWPTGEIGGMNSPNWYTANHPAGSVNYDWAPQSYKSYIVTLLETAYEATGNQTFLEPLRLEAQIAQDYIRDPGSPPVAGTYEWAGMVLGSNAINAYQRTLDRFGLPGSSPSSTLWRPSTVVGSCTDGYNYIRKCYPLMTTEASATDRALFVGVANPFLIFTGGSVGGALLAPQFTYSGLGRDFAGMVRDANTRSANISIYGFFQGIREAHLVPWALEVGANYTLTIGPDPDSDGIAGSIIQTVGFQYLTRGQKVPFTLPGNGEYVLSLERTIPGSGLRQLIPDPAFGEEGVVVDTVGDEIRVMVHNIGSLGIEGLDISLMEGDSEIGGGALDLDAPEGLLPSVEEASIRLWKAPSGTSFEVVIDPNDNILEICETNNVYHLIADLSDLEVFPPLDLPIEFNGTLPILYVYEDNASSGVDLLNLSEYIWDPDGHGMVFSSIEPVHFSKIWLAGVRDGIVWWSPSALNGDNYSGTGDWAFRGRGPGQDGIWENSDDVKVDFNLTFVILPVNDPPVLVRIDENGTSYYPENGTLTIPVNGSTGFHGILIASDVDLDPVSFSVIDPSNRTLISDDVLHFVPGRTGLLTGITLTLDDGNISVNYSLSFDVFGEVPPPVKVPVFLGISFDQENLTHPVVEGVVHVRIDEWLDFGFSFVFDGTYDLEYTYDDEFPLDIYFEDLFSLGPFAVGHDGEDLSVRINWSLEGYPGINGSFVLSIRVDDVNMEPTTPSLWTKAYHKVGEEVEFTLYLSSDLDGDPLTYNVSFGDGTERTVVPATHFTHIYNETGTYTVTITADDGYGGISSSRIMIRIVDADDGEDLPPVVIEPRDTTWLTVAVIALMLIVGSVIVAAMILTRKEKADLEE